MISAPLTAEEIFAQIRQEADALMRVDFGIPYLDDALLGMFPRETTLIGARTGGGKTEFATQVLLTQQSGKNAKSVLYFALDHDPGEIENRLLWRILVNRVRQDDNPEIKNCYLRYADWRAGKYLGLFDAYEREYRTKIAHLLSLSETKLVYRKGGLTASQIAQMILTQSDSYRGSEYNLFIVDHFHAIKLEGRDKFAAQGDAIRILSDAAQEAERPLLLLGQFKKRNSFNKSPLPDSEEFSGDSNLTYIPQNIVVFGPNYSEGASHGSTYFHVAKARTASDAKAFVGVHSFNLLTKNYSDQYWVKRFIPNTEPTELKPGEVPRWAKKAIRPRVFEERV